MRILILQLIVMNGCVRSNALIQFSGNLTSVTSYIRHRFKVRNKHGVPFNIQIMENEVSIQVANTIHNLTCYHQHRISFRKFIFWSKAFCSAEIRCRQLWWARVKPNITMTLKPKIRRWNQIKRNSFESLPCLLLTTTRTANNSSKTHLHYTNLQ